MRGPTRYLTVIVIALAVPAFLGAAAWGGEPLSKKKFLKQGNAICEEANEQIGALADDTFALYTEDDEVPPEVLETFAAGIVPIFRQAIADIDALEPPTKDARKVQKIVDAYTEALDAIEADPSSFASRSSGGEDPFKKPNKLAPRYGLKKCAEGVHKD